MTIDRSQSQTMLERTAKVIPGGVASSLRALDTAFFVDRGKGSRIWDVDGGAQEYYGVIPDLTVLAKGLGCGVPIAALGGKKAVMDTISNWTMPHYGTYNANSLCVAGALAGLRELEQY